MAGEEDKMEVEPVADDDAAAKKLAAKAAKGPKKALPAPRFEIKKWNVSSLEDDNVCMYWWLRRGGEMTYLLDILLHSPLF